MKHELKIERWSYDAIVDGDKTFEIRYNNDRGFQKGDTVILRPWSTSCYDTSVPAIAIKLTYVTTYQQKDGMCVFGFRVWEEYEAILAKKGEVK